MNPSVGRIVRFFTSDGPAPPKAAIIVHVWSAECVNLQVFPTGVDGDMLMREVVTSVMHGTGARQWDWPERT